MRSFIILTFITLTLNSLSAKEVSINGIFPGAENKEFRVYTYTDLMTYNEKFVTKTIIDKKGKFSLKINIDDVSILFLKVDFCKSVLYAEPGKTYNLLFDTLVKDSYNETTNPFLNPLSCFYEIDNLDNTELNYLINKFKIIYSQFISENALALIRKRNKKVVQDFKLKVDSTFSGIKNSYFSTFIKYKIAAIEEVTLTESRNSLYKKYFHKQTVLVNNEGYMEFFNQFFTKFFTNVTQKVKFKDLEAVINEQNSYLALMDTLGKDSMLQNELIRELVLIKGLSELYEVSGFSKENILSILTSVAEKSKFNDNRNISRTMLKNLSEFPNGTAATDFSLPDKKQQIYTLSQYKGKYVYLFFWNTRCAMCLSEMGLLNDLKKKYADKLEIIGISIDMEPLNLHYFLEKNEFDFPIVHFAFNYNLIESYYVQSLPYFVLIDKDRTIIKCPVSKPSENIYKELDLQLNKK